jgi:hypothetical protein
VKDDWLLFIGRWLGLLSAAGAPTFVASPLLPASGAHSPFTHFFCTRSEDLDWLQSQIQHVDSASSQIKE